ncbi:MAG: hypothetical protein SFW35_10240 [Chitinophagales bacterium]|nr:hypothetical protein [Chitinophagales bacterium]
MPNDKNKVEESTKKYSTIPDYKHVPAPPKPKIEKEGDTKLETPK